MTSTWCLSCRVNLTCSFDFVSFLFVCELTWNIDKLLCIASHAVVVIAIENASNICKLNRFWFVKLVKIYAINFTIVKLGVVVTEWKKNNNDEIIFSSFHNFRYIFLRLLQFIIIHNKHIRLRTHRLIIKFRFKTASLSRAR
jgi:hypothetical protein